MKKLVSLLLTAAMLLSLATYFTACGSNTSGGDSTAAEATATPEPIPVIGEGEADVITQRWVACEISFEASETNAGALGSMIMDVEFKNRTSGTTLTIPAFWNGDSIMCVRFAPTEYGIWDYTTKCSTDEALNGKTGTVGSNEYTGDLEIYKRGFVTVQSDNKYFTYADGTPFFYLGDTHWNYLTEEFDKAGKYAGSIQTDSHFKYIVDKRVEQGFTVYQSEPIGNSFNLTSGKITKSGIKGFQTADKYYQYIADKGLVHANAEFFFASEMSASLMKNEAALELISRYWVARYGAYPVMWTLAQEIDNDFYYERGDQKIYDYTKNPWVKVAEYIHKYDAYQHPLSGHQENTGTTTVTGAGTSANASGSGISAFLYAETVQGNKNTGHNWWAAQWSPSLKSQLDETVPKNYWSSPKPAVLYEGRYCYLWTKDFGARVQGWAAYLSGMYGYGYGAIEIWLYQSSYNIDEDSNDGVETISKADKKTPWSTAIEFQSGYQVGYMKQFLQKLEWWKLTPDFNSKTHFVPDSGAVYVCAYDEQNTYVVYLYNKTTDGGTIVGLDSNASYSGQWFNPRTNEYQDAFDISGVSYKLQKPDAEDWVFVATKK